MTTRHLRRPGLNRRHVLAAGAAAAAGVAGTAWAQGETLRYGHNNEPASTAGAQADWFAEEVARISGGDLRIDVYPASQLGKQQELAEAVALGSIQVSHNTASAYGSLFEPFAALDTPYIYEDVDHLLRVVDATSPVMERLNRGLIEAANVRVIYGQYFGKRCLTCDRPILAPADLSGVRIRAIPFPIYTAAVEGLGAVAVPVDWSEVPTALATGIVSGQENPVNVILTVKLYELQSHLMLTNHMRTSLIVTMNEDAWKGLSNPHREAILEAAQITRQRASNYVLDNEESDTQALRDAGMTVIDEADGLQVGAFRDSVQAVIRERFGETFGEYYDLMRSLA
jgi:tripartite ATP-independent transporter DctP family solute receptor